MPTLIAHLLRSRLRGKRLLGAVALTLVAPTALTLTELASPGRPVGVNATEALLSAWTAGGLFLSLGMILLSAPTLRDERDDHTIAWLVLTPRPRWHVAVAATVAAVLACAVLAGIATVAMGLLSTALGIGPGPGLSTWSYSLACAVGFGSLSTLVGWLAPRGVVVMMFYAFVWEAFAGTILPLAANSSLLRIALSVWGSFIELPQAAVEVMGPVTVGAGGGVAKLAGVTVVTTVVLWQTLRRFDLG